jgi:L-ascorbate metabolism protein UlaG (beta-lactamase superfamily)
MNVTYYGHACFAVEIAGKHLLFDPFITPNPLAKAIDIHTIPADFILVSHGHDDHMTDATAIAQRTGALVVANFEVAEWLAKEGAPRVHPVNPGGSFDLGVATVKSVIAIHSSSLPDGSYGGCPAGFVVESDEGNFYYSGDTALTYDMKLIAEATQLEFAVLCVGNNFTMGFEDAARAAEFIHCNDILGVHYDTFPPIKIDHAKAQEKFKASGRTLHLMQIGETRSL